MEMMTMQFKKQVDSVKRARIIRHRKMRELKISLCCGSIGFIFGLTPYVLKFVELKRGYIALGSETFFPCLAVAAYYLINAVIDEITDRLDERDEANRWQ